MVLLVVLRALSLPAIQQWTVSLDAAGLVALADLTTIAKRTALTGTTSLLDILVVAPGIHRQQYATELNRGEYPTCGSLSTGYVFRLENPATIMFLQSIGVTGHLTPVSVSKDMATGAPWWQGWLSLLHDFRLYRSSTKGTSSRVFLSASCYFLAVGVTITILTTFVILQDWWAVTVLSLLMFARAINFAVLRHRTRRRDWFGKKKPCWYGRSEPGNYGDLLVLLSQDRWIRLQGTIDDLKAVTAGTWFQEANPVEVSFTGFSVVLVYLDAALAGNARTESKVLLLFLLFASAGLLSLSNELTRVLIMNDRVVWKSGQAVEYTQRLDLAAQLIKEKGDDAQQALIGMGIILAKHRKVF